MKYFLILSLFLIPLQVSAQVIITEIMYDLEGSDTGREWVEITNTGSSSIDLSSFKFFENETNHGLTIFEGDVNLEPNQSAIIADDANKFILDWPNFTGTIFNSSFSLKNTGESISIRNSNLEDLDTVNFTSDWGAKGDGKSLNKNANGTWSPLTPTPGVYSQSSGTSSDSETVTSATSGGGPSVNFPVGQIKTKIISSKVVLSGADNFFESYSLGVEGEKLENARHLWNFGDGAIKEGERVLHRYIYPGEYVVFLDVSSESFMASDKTYIKVIPSSISISTSNQDLIRIKNDSNEEINVSYWILKAGDKFFSLPKNTYIKSKGEISFSSEITKLNGNDRPLRILYPNGVTAYDFSNITIPIVSTKEKSLPTKLTNEVTPEKKEDGLLAAATFSNIERPLITEEILTEKSENHFSKWIVTLIALILFSSLSFIYLKQDNRVEELGVIE